MSTTVRRPDQAATAERTLRILPIAANLLPPEIAASRRVRMVRRIVVLALIVFAALLVVWYLATSWQTAAARRDLSRAEDVAQRLVRQQHTYSQVVAVQAESRAVRAQLATLLTYDLQWSALLSSLQKAAPKEVRLTGITSALASGLGSEAATPAGGTAGELPNSSGAKSIGSITITGTSTTKAAVAAYVDALAKVRGIETPLLGDVSEQEGKLQFSVKVNLTKTILGGRYTPKKPAGAPTTGGQ
jgi:Tfp pilus assembly protein PilN